MFKKILIANRGEIATRIIKTCRQQGVRTVAVFSEADRTASHLDLADEAVPIGPAQASLSYLSIPNIIQAARNTGAQAIHPGYGFLSENADFADACKENGIILIGPPASSMRAMGSKAAAKALMAKAGVPLVPGYHGDAQDTATLTAAAYAIGYPVLVKASAGGGGRGMRIVEHAEALPEALQGAAREALASFNDGRLLIEKYLTQPRHIEIQVFADTHGNIVSLFERDCSIQRRHQKVIEEAPAPGMDQQRRTSMGEAAIAAARAVGYVGAGTVEFIVEHGNFYFMEMNTRLQVEHPVTEMITGQDLVEWQLRVACGERLPLLQDDLHISGHAMEARIYAEDPAAGFLPSIGRIVHLREPEQTAHVRVDSGVQEGDRISPYYDAMIAKLIVWGSDRAACLRYLQAALDDYAVVGVQTNLDLLRAIAAEPDFAVADMDTGFIGRHPALLSGADGPVAPELWAAAVLAARADLAATPVYTPAVQMRAVQTPAVQMRAVQTPAVQTPAVQTADPWSPWTARDAWRMNGQGRETILLEHQGVPATVTITHSGGAMLADLPTGAVQITATDEAAGMVLRLDGTPHRLGVIRHQGGLTVVRRGRNTVFRVLDPLAPPAKAMAAAGRLTAPIPGRVTRVLVAEGDHVRRGAALVVLEAMKMELTISAPADAIVDRVLHQVDAMVQEGAELVRLTPLPAA